MEKLPWEDEDNKIVSFKKEDEDDWLMKSIPAIKANKEKGFLVIFASRETDLYEDIGYAVIEKDMDDLTLELLMGEPIFSSRMEADLYALHRLGYFDKAIEEYQI